MIDVTAILRELEKLEAVQVKLAGISSRTDDGRRYDLIALRRELSAQIALTGKLLDPLFESAGNAELTRVYRVKLSTMRTAAALHQASWPAVRLGTDVIEYQTSARRVRDANQDFIEWVRTIICDLLRKS